MGTGEHQPLAQGAVIQGFDQKSKGKLRTPKRT